MAPRSPNYASAQPMMKSVPFTIMARQAPASAVAPSVMHPVPPGIDDEEWYEKWWVWTLIGVGVAGAVTAGLILGLPATQEAPVGFTAKVRME